ncbi:rhodanese-like domain-containing protein [Enterovibrio sp. 27052020O]|uniref:rhodanese-like domain-containing protein n=1 Tax=Enterovibrio sp. 27052020O TaxID=3241166 RepID=UPI00389070D6
MTLMNTKHIVIALMAILLSATATATATANAEPVWIDTRSAAEHFFDNIPGDVRISHSDIVEEVSTLYPDKNTEIRLYCLSGARSGSAMEALKKAGYQNVSNAGGISDARVERGLKNE